MKNLIKIVIFLIFFSIVIYILNFSPYSYYFFTEKGRIILQEKFQYYTQKIGIWGIFVFIGFYAISIMLFVPASVFTSIGGFIFGNWLGFLINYISALIGGVLSFFISRYLLRDFAAKILQHRHFKKFDDKIEEHGFSIILYMRLMFIPFTYLSFAAGISKISFKSFFWGTVFGVGPGILVITFLAAAIKQLVLTYKSPIDLLRPDIIFPVALFIFSFFIPKIIKHYKEKFHISNDLEKDIESDLK